jgi:hypothetical protein
MAGKTQFTERWTVNLTPEQEEAAFKLLSIYDRDTKQEFLTDLLKDACAEHGVEWPEAVKRPIGNRTPRKGKFTKP